MRFSYLRLISIVSGLLSAVLMQAQNVQFGLAAGVPLTETFAAGGRSSGTYGMVFSNIDVYTSDTKRLLIGPRVAVSLPFRLQLQADGIYQRISYNQISSFGTPSSGTFAFTSANGANRWQLATVLKRKLSAHFPLFVQAGAAWSFITAEHRITNGVSFPLAGPSGQYTITSNSLPELRRGSVAGFTTGAGWDFHFLFIHIAPEIRYTRWGAEHFRDPTFPQTACSLLCSNRNEADFLLGVTF